MNPFGVTAMAIVLVVLGGLLLVDALRNWGPLGAIVSGLLMVTGLFMLGSILSWW